LFIIFVKWKLYLNHATCRAADGATALMIAAQNGNLKVVEELLNRGADPDLAAHNHTMALHLAIHSGNLR